MRAVVQVEEINKRTCLVISELPYQVNPDNLALKIAELVKDGKIKGIADVRDEGNERLGQRLVIVLQQSAIPERPTINPLVGKSGPLTIFNSSFSSSSCFISGCSSE